MNSAPLSKYNSGTTYPYCDTSARSSDSRISWNGTTFSVVPGLGNHPMVMVSWYGAAAYANWRSSQQGVDLCYSTTDFTPDLSKHGYRLPTEAEWEYAARGGQAGRQYPGGDTIVTTQANYWASGDPYETGDYPRTTPVGFYNGSLQQKATYNWPGAATSYQTSNYINGYGLYDVAGNAWEWCNDRYGDTYYDSSPFNNPPGPTSGSYRVLRGGGWLNDAPLLRVAYRAYDTPSLRDLVIGFRLALDFN